MPIYQTARFRVRSEAVEECKAAIAEFVREVNVREPRTLLYSAWQDAEDPTSFVHFFVFQDEAARELHRGTEWVKRFTGILYPETLDGVEFRFYQQVATTASRP